MLRMLHALHVAPNEEEQSEKRRICEEEDGGREREREEREGEHITVIAQRYFIAFAQRRSGRRSAWRSIWHMMWVCKCGFELFFKYPHCVGYTCKPYRVFILKKTVPNNWKKPDMSVFCDRTLTLPCLVTVSVRFWVCSGRVCSSIQVSVRSVTLDDVLLTKFGRNTFKWSK